MAIVETLPEVHLAISGLLENATDVCIVGHARSLAELVAAGPDDPDVLVADLRNIVGSPEALERLRRRHRDLRLIVTTMDSGREYEEAIARLAADAWLSKADLGTRLLSTLRSLGPRVTLPRESGGDPITPD